MSQAAHRDKRSGDENGAYGDLQTEQSIAQGKAVEASSARGAGANGLPWVGAEHLAYWNQAEEEAAQERQQDGQSIGACVRIDRHIDRDIGNGPPCAEHAQDNHGSEDAQDASGERDQAGFGEQLANDELAA